MKAPKRCQSQRTQSPSKSSSSHSRTPNLQRSRSQKTWELQLGHRKLGNCCQDEEKHGDAIEASRNIRVSSELILLARVREQSEEEDFRVPEAWGEGVTVAKPLQPPEQKREIESLCAWVQLSHPDLPDDRKVQYSSSSK